MIVRLVYWLIRLVTLPLWAPVWWLRRRVPQDAYVYLEVDGAVADVTVRRFWGSNRTLSLHVFNHVVDAVIADSRVRGVVIILRGFSGGLATATSMREALVRVKTSGKEVVVHLPVGGGNKEMYLASAATRIVLGPQATLAPVGFVSSTRYLKNALDKVGVEADILARGTYKSAGETLARDSMSEPQREQVGAILDEMYDALATALSEGRNVDSARARELIDGAPYRAKRAIEMGLIDDACYEDELPSKLGSGSRPATLVEAFHYRARRDSRLLPRLRRRPVLGVIRVHGAIVGATPSPLGGDRVASDEHVIAAIRVARMSSRVRGVVLHIDSPGGSALASDRMHHELVQLAREKPLIACMANVAASGGYYVAAATHHIVAQPTTITGSIGVVSARFMVEPLLHKLGIVTETMQRGAHAGLLDGSKTLNDDERVALDREIGAVYDAFIDVVASGRQKLTRETVESLAQGRVWTGRAAHARGLVDALGGFDVATAEVCKRLGVPVDALEVIVVRPPWSKIPPLALPPTQASALVNQLLQFTGVDELGIFLRFGSERVVTWSHLAASFFE